MVRLLIRGGDYLYRRAQGISFMFMGLFSSEFMILICVLIILAIFYPPLKQIWGCVWLFLQAQEGHIYFTELAERVEYGNYVTGISHSICTTVLLNRYIT